MPTLEVDAKLLRPNLWGDTPETPSRGKIADTFAVPPFTVLSARDGWWRDRKRAWIARGIKSEIGRADDLAFNIGAWCADKGKSGAESNTSIFDPVLCELTYRWFAPPGGMVLDPFAGGSVRGIVAALMGRKYHGIDLRAEQVAANYDQARVIAPDADLTWVAADSAVALADAPAADLVFSCPPYADLERYSDDPRDLSAMDYPAFADAYRWIVAAACARLKDHRFAVFVVGDVRDKAGFYRGLPELTVAAFADAGLRKYNEAVLATSVGSLPVRITAQFDKSRKMGKTHQNVYVFVKGDPRKATAAIAAPTAADIPDVA